MDRPVHVSTWVVNRYAHREEEVHMRLQLHLGTVATALVVAVLLPVPAQAVDSPPAPEQLTFTTTVTEDTYATNGKLVSHKEYPATTATNGEGGHDTTTSTGGGSVALSSSGGASSASGCKNLNVMKEGKTFLGFTAYQFINSTHWCWTRSTQTVYDVSTNWWLGTVDSQYKWDSIIDYIHGFYDYSANDGHPYSAFKNQRTGHFENCVLKYGCIGDIYPTVLIRSYYNGTYYWDTWS